MTIHLTASEALIVYFALEAKIREANTTVGKSVYGDLAEKINELAEKVPSAVWCFRKPETLEDLNGLFIALCSGFDLELRSAGVSYSNGDEHDSEIRFPSGFEAFVKMRESQDDNYLIERYPEEYGDAG